MEKEDDEEVKKKINSTIVGMAQSELVQTHGEAASQILQAFNGVRYDSAGNDLGHLGRSLKDISKYKVNPEYRNQNIKQQSGFSAELIKEARDNKEAIFNNKDIRTRTTDGIGQTNNQKYDHVKVDSSGNIIENSGSQMKFYGVDKNGRYKVIDKIVTDESWDRYDGQIDIPSEQYSGALEYADSKAKSLKKQANVLREKGQIAKAEKLEEQAKKYDEAKKRIRKSNVSSDEAIEARCNPKKFVAEEIIKDSHNAGLEAAKGALILSGSISVAQNIYAIISEDKPMDEAIKDITKTTVASGAMAYGVGVSGTAIKSIMHSSSKEIVRRIGNTNIPTMIATGTVAIVKSITRYGKGEIDEVQLLEELGEKGTGMIAAGFASATGATVGAAIGSVIPVVGTAIGATVGGFLGSIIGYSSSEILYKGCLESLKGAKISAERRKIIEELSRQSIKEHEEYREKLLIFAKDKYNKREQQLSFIFNNIEESILSNNINKFIKSINEIGDEFGVKLKFDNFEEIDDFMSDETTTFIL